MESIFEENERTQEEIRRFFGECARNTKADMLEMADDE
jgi:hypothetical protein